MRQVEPAGAAVGNLNALPAQNITVRPDVPPIGSVDSGHIDPYVAYKRYYQRHKSAGTVTPTMRAEFKRMKTNRRSTKSRRGQGLVANGLVNETTQGGKLVSKKILMRLI